MSGVLPFTPSPEVVQAHSLPHLDSQLKLIRDPQFVSIKEDAGTYIWSVSRFALFLASLAWLFVFFFYFSLCVRCCFKFCKRCVRCCIRYQQRGTVDEIPDNIHEEAEREAALESRLSVINVVRKRVTNHNKCRSCIVNFNLSLFVVMVVAAATVFKGDQNLSDSFDTVRLTLHLIINLFQNISAICLSGLGGANALIATVLAGGDCDVGFSESYQDAVMEQSMSIVKAMDSINGLASPVEGTLSHGIDVIGIANGKKTTVFVVWFFGVVFLVLVLQGGTFCKSSCVMRIGIFLSAMWVLLFSVLASASLVVTTFLGDFCIDPSNNIVNLFGSTSPIAQDLRYFLFCTGTNPFQPNLDIATQALATVNATLSAAINSGGVPPSCQATLNTNMDGILTSIAGIQGLISCTPIFELYDTAVQQALCNQGTAGVYNVMVVFFTVTSLTYLAMCTVSVFYHWYIAIDTADMVPTMMGRGKQDIEDGALGGEPRISLATSPPIWARETNDIQTPIHGRRIFGGGTAEHQVATPATMNPFIEDVNPAQSSFTIKPGAAQGGATKGAVTFEL